MILSLATPGIRSIVLDIEGTTTPIAFVHEILFSYARSRVKTFLTERFGSSEVVADLAKLREEHEVDVKRNLDPPELVEEPRNAAIDSVVSYVNWLIDRDRKSIGLKSLQGKIWKQGYVEGTLKAEVFADVAPALQRWRDAGLTISIFSSGSCMAQKLLFAHTGAGNLTRLIDNYFDVTLGSKTDVESYRRIAAALRQTSREIIFISDVVDELEAAGAAGMQTLLCVRPGNQNQFVCDRHQIIYSFDQI